MIVTSERMNTSITRMPRCMRKRMRSVSKAVMRTPYSKGMPKSRFKPIAMPITSARSHAAMATSAST